MKETILTVLLIFSSVAPVWAADGVVSVESGFNVSETVDRLESVLKEKGMTVFNRISHSEAAGKVGIELRDTALIIFGNPNVGSHLIKCQQIAAIDLPQKALVWEDDEARVWISYNDPRYIAKRHNLADCEEFISKIEIALAGIAKAASSK